MPRQPIPSIVLILSVAAFGALPPGAAGAPSSVLAGSAASASAHGQARGSVGSVHADRGPAPEVTVDQMTVEVPPSPAPAATPTAPPAETAPGAAPVTPSGGVVAATPDGTGHVQTAPIDTSAVQTVGVTWPEGRDGESLQPQMRTKVGTTWSGWQDLPVSDNAPDTGTADAARTRGGTDSVWIGDADAVQFGFATAEVAPVGDVKVALVGSDLTATTTSPAVWTAGSATVSAVAATTDVVDAAVAAPTIITRAEWGAAPEVCTPDVASTLVGAVVHHTADVNTYTTQAQAEQMIRNDQAYHINSRGWCDLGYNFVVDKWGNIYEGRANSLTQPVIGVHAGGFNTGTVGVAMLGDLTSVAPTAAELESVARVVGYRLGAYGRNPTGFMTYTTPGGENSRYAAGTTLTLPVVIGHRDVAYTACPGNLGYAALPAIRTRAQQIAYSEPLVRALYADMLGRGVDASGLATWTDMLMSGVSAARLGDYIAHSEEYASARVTAAYREMLGRDPDPVGQAYWTNGVMSGQFVIEDLRGWLASSDEYYQKAGGTAPAFVAQLYRDILHREAGPSEVAYWMVPIARSGRGIVNAGIWRSLESAQLRVNEAYQVFLDRPADPSGLAYWSPFWQTHGEDALRGVLVGSDEYLARSARLY